MQTFIDRATGTELTEAQFRRATLQRASLGSPVLPDACDALGYDLINQLDEPLHDTSRKKAVPGDLVPTGPAEFERGWAVVDLNPAELDAKAAEYAADLERARHAKAAELNQARDQADTSRFEIGGKQIAADALSVARITAISSYVALFGALPPEWAGGWKAIDNTAYPIPDVAAWKTFVTAMTAQGVANHAKHQALKAGLAQVRSMAEVAEVKWA